MMQFLAAIAGLSLVAAVVAALLIVGGAATQPRDRRIAIAVLVLGLVAAAGLYYLYEVLYYGDDIYSRRQSIERTIFIAMFLSVPVGVIAAIVLLVRGIKRAASRGSPAAPPRSSSGTAILIVVVVIAAISFAGLYVIGTALAGLR